jgi:hypothetical protein
MLSTLAVLLLFSITKHKYKKKKKKTNIKNYVPIKNVKIFNIKIFFNKNYYINI